MYQDWEFMEIIVFFSVYPMSKHLACYPYFLKNRVNERAGSVLAAYVQH